MGSGSHARSNWLLVLAGALTVGATLTTVSGHLLGAHDIRVELAGFAGYVAAATVGSIAIAQRFTMPLKRLERRALELASGADIEPQDVPANDQVASLIEAFNSVARRLNALSELAEVFAEASDRSVVLSGLASAMSHILDAKDVCVILLDADGRVSIAAGEGAFAQHHGEAVSIEQPAWVSQALAQTTPLSLVPSPDDPLLGRYAEAEAAAIVAPLRSAAEPLGLAVALRGRGETFSESERAALRGFSAQAAVALRTAELFEKERRSRGEAESLRRIAERAAFVEDTLETLDEIAGMEAVLLGLPSHCVVVYDRLDFGLPTAEDESGDRAWRIAWDAVDGKRTHGGATWISAEHAPHALTGQLAEAGASGVLLTPLHRGRTLAGFLVLLGDASSAAPSPTSLELAGTIGRQASLALENAYLYQQAKSRADNLETVFRISSAVGSSLQTRVVLNRVLDVVQKILSADAVLLMQYDTQRRLISSPMARGDLSSEMLDATFRPGEDIPGRVFETHEPERYDDISGNPTLLLNAAAKQGLASLLAVPLLARGRSIGVLAIFSRQPGAFTSDELHLLRTFASQAALAIDNAEMFSREHETVRVLQESILPNRLSDMPSLEASSVYLPGGGEAEIGGDYYDLFQAPDNRVMLAIGDVCGKGVAAATKTSMMRHAIRGMVVAGLQPARILAELNRMLLEAGDGAGNIVTLWLGSIDTSTGRLIYAGGGHPPALLMQPDHAIERLESTGALLGAIDHAAWEQQEARLSPEAVVLLYTDGVTEARRVNKFFGEGRVRRALRAGGSAVEITQRLLSHLQRYTGGSIRDDAAVLTVRYLPCGISCQDVTHGSAGGK